MLMSRRFRWAVLLLAFGLVVAACGGDDTGTGDGDGGASCAKEDLALVQPGVLTIATGEPAFPPWIIDDDPTNQEGFEGAVAYAVAEKLGFDPSEVEWVRTGFDEAIAPGEKSFDFNLQQYTITEQRDEVVDFSVPYYTTNQALVAYADSPIAGATSIEELRDAKLGAQIGTTSLAYIEEVIQPTEQAAVYDSNVDAKSALDAQQVDGLVFDLPTAYYITAVEIPEATIVGAFEVSEEQADNFGFLMAEGSDLKPCVDQALEELRADGTLDSLAEQWLQTESEIPTISG